MNRLTRLSAHLLAAVLLLQPLAGLAQQKVFTPAELAQAQRDAAARAAAAAKKKAARAAAGQPVPVAPQPTAPAAGQATVIVNVTNNTGTSFRAVVAGPDGSPQVVGEIPPSAQAGGPTQLQTFAGQEWGFANAEGQIVSGYTATSAPQQRFTIGPTGQNAGSVPQPQPPVGNSPQAGAIRLTVQNGWGGPVTASRVEASGSIKNFNIGANGGTLISAPDTRWTFTAGGQVIFEYVASAQPKQAITLPSPQELQAVIQQKAGMQAATQQATAAKQQRQQAFLARLNEARLQAGVPGVTWSPKLAEKAAQTYNPTGGGFSMAVTYVQGGPQSPLEALEYWFAENWGKAQVLLDQRVTTVGFWEDPKRGVGFEYAPR